MGGGSRIALLSMPRPAPAEPHMKAFASIVLAICQFGLAIEARAQTHPECAPYPAVDFQTVSGKQISTGSPPSPARRHRICRNAGTGRLTVQIDGTPRYVDPPPGGGTSCGDFTGYIIFINGAGNGFYCEIP